MKRLATLFAVSLFLLLNVLALAQEKTNADDSTAVLATVTDYIEAYYTGDARRMEQTLHPHYLKHKIHGDIPVQENTGLQMVQEVRANGPANMPAANKTEQVSVLDLSGPIASAKLITPGWTDYMILEKVEGQWKILSVVQRIDN